MSDSPQEQEIKALGLILLRTGSMLMSNGASTARIRMTIDRIANYFGYDADLFITHRALTLSLSDKENDHTFSSLKRTDPQGVNFKIVSGISRMSWSVKEQGWSFEKIEKELDRLSSIPHYPRLLLLALVALAGASFCGLAGGNPLAMCICFAASFIGLFVRQEAHKKHFNIYLCVFFAAFTAAMFAGSFCKLFPNSDLEKAFATSVLFLIPGVPLINSFTDLFDGNILNGMLRIVHGLIIAFMIALGLVCSIAIYKF
jgi:uncharacterized membrane protein YjjP (DUF1212 family)